MLKKWFTLISASFLGVVFLLALIFASVVAVNSQAESAVLSNETMTQLIGGVECNSTYCEKGKKIQPLKPKKPPFAVDCTNCAEETITFEPRIYSCQRCDWGETKHYKVRLCRKRVSFCATFGYEDADPPCKFKSECRRKGNKSLEADDCENLVTPTQTCT